METNLLEVEVEGPLNENLSFRPLQRTLRGRWDWTKCASPDAHRHGVVTYGGLPIPGQVLGIDTASSRGYLREPLHEPAHAALAEKIKTKGKRLPPAREDFEGVHVPTWLFWIAAAVRAGLARVVSGKLPDAIDESGVRKDFLFAPPKPSERDRLSAALENMAAAQHAQTEVLSKLLAALAKK